MEEWAWECLKDREDIRKTNKKRLKIGGSNHLVDNNNVDNNNDQSIQSKNSRICNLYPTYHVYRIKGCCMKFCQILFFIMILWFVLPSLFTTSHTETKFSFEPSKSFPHEVTSSRLNIKYFVNDHSLTKLTKG